MLVLEQQFMNTVIRELPKIAKSLNEIRENTQKPVTKSKLAENYWLNEVKFVCDENNVVISDTKVKEIVDKILYQNDFDYLWERINEAILDYVKAE